MIVMAKKKLPKWASDLKARREAKGWKQPEAAERLGVPVATLRNWEQGRVKPRSSALKLLDLVYG